MCFQLKYLALLPTYLVIMAPHKQPGSLLSLATIATVKSINYAVVNIDEILSTEPAYQENINNIQQFLLQYIPFHIWDSVFEALAVYILYHRFPLYSITHCSIQIHQNMRKLNAKISPFTKDFDKLKNLVELDLSSLSYTATSYLDSIGSVCKKLDRISFNALYMEDCVRMLAGCTELRAIKYRINNLPPQAEEERLRVLKSECAGARLALETFPKLEHYSYGFMGGTLLSLDSTSPLRLRFVKEGKCTVRCMERIISLCPHLKHLDIVGYYASSNLETLTSSPLELTHFSATLQHFDDKIETFFEKKGIHLLRLTLISPRIPIWVCQVIAKNCVNVAYLKLDSPYQLTGLVPFCDTFHFKEQESLMTKLEEIEYGMKGHTLDVRVLTTILPKRSNLVSLSIETMGVAVINRLLVEVLTNTSMLNLKKFHLGDMGVCIGEPVLRGFYERCPQLTCVDVAHLDQAAENYLTIIRKEVTDNNLDFSISHW